MLELEVLILKLCSVDALASCSISLVKAPPWSMNRNDVMEGVAFASVAALKSAQLEEVLSCFGDYIRAQFHHNAASWLRVYGDIEEDHWV